MELLFCCPETGQVFRSSAFAVREYRGVRDRGGGNRELDAVVELVEPCPLCGGAHSWRPAELPCPWDGSDGKTV
ncbi:MAG: hypothetical protein ACOX5Z_12140 [Desulfobulbus sp.]|jgi:hypothetical protein